MLHRRNIGVMLVLCLGVFAVWQGWQGSRETAEAFNLRNRLSDYLFAQKAAGTWVNAVGSSWADYGMVTLGADGTVLWQSSAYHGQPGSTNIISAAQGNWIRTGERELTGTYCLFSNYDEPPYDLRVWVLVTSVVSFNEDFTEANPHSNHVWYFRADENGDGVVDENDRTPLDPDAEPYFAAPVGPAHPFYRVPVWQF
jgi:hypothetical protein